MDTHTRALAAAMHPNKNGLAAILVLATAPWSAGAAAFAVPVIDFGKWFHGTPADRYATATEL